mmetsp:Transcript_64753/g.162952  ORF Transcript_64753/g.162952 Transcript_64753/m.162952 type:complete len:574 (-) Transcript_64753:107-1828(-)
MPKAQAKKQPAKPFCQPGGCIREQAHVFPDGQPPKFKDLYELDKDPLGEGRYSRVYAATHKVTRARRAVKTAMRRGQNTIADVGMECPGRLARHEADIIKSLDHPNVIRLYEVYEEEEAVHLVLELCEGSDVLERIVVSKGRLTEHEISLLFIQMLYSVWHLHSRGVIHRDLKPEHFLFTRKEKTPEYHPPRLAALKVIDFGLSHLAGANFVPLGGTPQFMPPEIINGQVPDSGAADRVDMWALGVVLHAMLVGHYPSPHLKDETQAQYFSKSAWSSTSRGCLDLLGQLLRQKGASRPTVFEALQHPWAQAAHKARGEPSPGLVQSLPHALEAYSKSPGLRKLAMCAVAHELDDYDFYSFRVLHQVLLLNGSRGCLNKKELDELEKKNPELKKVVSTLSAGHGDPVSASGAGPDAVYDWTEILAAGAIIGTSEAVLEPDKAKVKLDMAWSAFDLLSLSSEEITADTLRRLMAYKAPGPRGGFGLKEAERERQNDEEGAKEAEAAAVAAGQDALAAPEEFDKLVEEYFPKEKAIPWPEFWAIMTGKLEPEPKGLGRLCCWSRKKCKEPTDDHRI